jgi:hypothetical protein
VWTSPRAPTNVFAPAHSFRIYSSGSGFDRWLRWVPERLRLDLGHAQTITNSGEPNLIRLIWRVGYEAIWSQRAALSG